MVWVMCRKSTDLTALCQVFSTRDIRAEDKPLKLISSTGTQSQTNPEVFWLASTWRRPLTAALSDQYDCLLNKTGGLA
jgi:hypothetical protein